MKLKFSKLHKQILTLSLSAVLIAAAVLVPNILKVKAEKIDETNPELKLINIDGDVETENGDVSYSPQGDIKQSGNSYDIRSNAYCYWGTTDDVTFAYKEFNVAPKDSDSLTVEATMNSFAPEISGSAVHINASSGIMIRSSLSNDAAGVFLHVRQQGLMIVYRTKTAGGWKFTNAKSVSYPLQLRVTVQKNSVECRYKGANDITWKLAGYASMEYTGPIYAGLGIHSVSESTFVKSNFTDLKFSGEGTYDPDNNDSSDTSSASKPTEKIDPDLDLSSNESIVLYETFSDDKKLAISKDAWTLTNKKYKWTSGQKNFDYDNNGTVTEHAPKYAERKVENGNRFLYKQLLQDSIDFIGDEAWSDYKVSMDFQYTEKCDPKAKNANNVIALSARSRIVEWYGYSDYAATVQNEFIDNKDQMTVSLYKHVNSSATKVSNLGTRLGKAVNIDNILGDGTWHNLAISVFDNIITVSFDGKEVIKYTDDGLSQKNDLTYGTGGWEEIIGFGRVGVKTVETDAYIDNIIVELTPDTINGDYDNYVGGGWDDPIPETVKDWTENKKYSYYFNGINGKNAAGSKKNK